MDRQIERRLRERAVALGNGADGAAAVELMEMLRLPSPQARRLAASALGKLAGLTDAASVVAALAPLLRDPHPQVRQYTIRALSAYGAAAESALADLRDLAANEKETEYNRRDAAHAIGLIEEAVRVAREEAKPTCQRCRRPVSADEFARSHHAFQRVFCDKCFDEVYLDRRNFDVKVELNKTIPAGDGRLVQSDGERQIADFLSREGIACRYDERFRIIDGYAIRPDFYLPEFDLHIEYWGMDTLDYKIGMLKKLKLYQQQGKRLISIYREDKPRIEQILREKLSRHIRLKE